MESISHFKLLKRSAFPLVFPDLVNSTLFTKMLKLKPYSHLDLGFYLRATFTSSASLSPYHPEHTLSHLILEDSRVGMVSTCTGNISSFIFTMIILFLSIVTTIQDYRKGLLTGYGQLYFSQNACNNIPSPAC